MSWVTYTQNQYASDLGDHTLQSFAWWMGRSGRLLPADGSGHTVVRQQEELEQVGKDSLFAECSWAGIEGARLSNFAIKFAQLNFDTLTYRSHRINEHSTDLYYVFVTRCRIV
jgi:hypothetical protein